MALTVLPKLAATQPGTRRSAWLGDDSGRNVRSQFRKWRWRERDAELDAKRTRRFDVLLGAVDLPLFVSSSPMTDAVAISTSGQILSDATGSGGENTVLLRRGDNQVAKSLGINQLVP